MSASDFVGQAIRQSCNTRNETWQRRFQLIVELKLDIVGFYVPNPIELSRQYLGEDPSHIRLINLYT